jgi:hypothetical protein
MNLGINGLKNGLQSDGKPQITAKGNSGNLNQNTA